MFISYEIQGDIVPGSSKFKFDIVDVGFSLLEYSICNLFFLQCLVLVLSCLYNVIFESPFGGKGKIYIE